MAESAAGPSTAPSHGQAPTGASAPAKQTSLTDDEWEYEYSVDDTESHYITLDLMTYVNDKQRRELPEEQPQPSLRKRKRSGPLRMRKFKAVDNDQDDDDDDVDAVDEDDDDDDDGEDDDLDDDDSESDDQSSNLPETGRLRRRTKTAAFSTRRDRRRGLDKLKDQAKARQRANGTRKDKVTSPPRNLDPLDVGAAHDDDDDDEDDDDDDDWDGEHENNRYTASRPLPPSADPLETIQILDLHTEKPLLAHRGSIFELDWGSTVGTDLHFIVPSRGRVAARLLGASSSRLYARSLALRYRGTEDLDPDDEVFAPIPEGDGPPVVLAPSRDTAMPDADVDIEPSNFNIEPSNVNVEPPNVGVDTAANGNDLDLNLDIHDDDNTDTSSNSTNSNPTAPTALPDEPTPFLAALLDLKRSMNEHDTPPPLQPSYSSSSKPTASPAIPHFPYRNHILPRFTMGRPPRRGAPAPDREEDVLPRGDPGNWTTVRGAWLRERRREALVGVYDPAEDDGEQQVEGDGGPAGRAVQLDDGARSGVRIALEAAGDASSSPSASDSDGSVDLVRRADGNDDDGDGDGDGDVDMDGNGNGPEGGAYMSGALPAPPSNDT